MNWTLDDYFEIVRLLTIRRDISMEELSPTERAAYVEICTMLAQACKTMIPSAQFGFLGGRPHKIPTEKHSEVRKEVKELTDAGIPKSEAYERVALNFKKASPKTIERICQDRCTASPVSPSERLHSRDMTNRTSKKAGGMSKVADSE